MSSFRQAPERASGAPDPTPLQIVPNFEVVPRAPRVRAGPWLWVKAAFRLARARVVRLIFPAALRQEVERLSASETYFQSLIENALDTITLIDAAGTIKYESPSVERVLGWKAEDLLGTNVFEYVHPADRGIVLAEFDRLLTEPGRVQSIELKFRHKDGSWRDMEVIGRNLLHDDRIDGVVVNARDITARKEVESQLLFDAFHDKLTGLPNRALFMDRMTQAIKRQNRPHPHFIVLFLDVDRFKLVNDSLGHTVGDALLVQLADRLEAAVQPGDTVARLGGDEFTILLDGVRSIRAAERVAERIHADLTRPFRIGDHELFATASIGMAASASHYARPEELLRDADLAMYRAKALGRARHEIFDQAMHETAVAALETENELRRALERELLHVAYQPIVDLSTGALRGFEALVRWDHPRRGLLAPVEFLPIAEDSGLIIPLGLWVLEQAAREVGRWQRELGADGLFVTVNLSAKQFAQPDLVQRIGEIMRRTETPGRLIKLELTESTVMERPEDGALTLDRLKQLGVGLCIDDFGTGYSSLGYLHQFPMDTLKIDRTFTSRLGPERQEAGIVRSVIRLGQDLDLDVVAEGIETPEQREVLMRLGCGLGQGHLFSRALEPAGVVELVRSGRSWPPEA